MKNSEDPDEMLQKAAFHQRLHCFLMILRESRTEVHDNKEISTCDPLKYIVDNSNLIALICMGKSIRI